VWYAALGAAAIAAYYMLPRAGVGQAVVLVIVNTASVVATTRAAVRARGTIRVVWIALGCAMLCDTLANIPYYAIPLLTGRPSSFPSAIDVLFLLPYLCYIVALLALARHRRRGDGSDDILDITLLTLGGGTLMWIYVIGPVIQAPAESLVAHIVSVAYPAMDLAVFAAFIRLMVSGLHRSNASRLLLGAFVLLLASDMVYASQLLSGTYAIGGPTDGLWMGSYLLTGVAATHPAATRFPRAAAVRGLGLTRLRLTFLCISALVGPLLLLVNHDEAVVVGVTSLVSFLLVMARLTGLNWRLQSMSQELQTRATTDALTGLSNRPALTAALTAALARGPHGVTLLLVDLDEFKQVNDLAGHSAGDAVLVEVAQRMQSVIRDTDVIARLGGDEFAVLGSGSASDGRRLGERLIGALREPFTFDGRGFALGASIGVVVAGPGALPERLVQDADIAMYAAKHAGKNRVVVFEESMYADIVQRSDFGVALESAVVLDEMRVEYQPIVRLGDGAVVGVEALARWRHPVFGDVPPGRFIPVAEASGVIVPLGRWVMRTALRDLARLHGTTETPLSVNVNVSAVQLLDPGFAADVAAALHATGIDGHRLVVELTEGALVNHSSESVRQLEELGALGVRISIDDFGTGYSSLGYLQRLPVEEVKIDRSFVDGIDRGDSEGKVARAILRMCEALGLRCIAEGVERPGQVAVLRAAGCDLAQGFHLGPPMPLEQVALRLPAPSHATARDAVCVA